MKPKLIPIRFALLAVGFFLASQLMAQAAPAVTAVASVGAKVTFQLDLVSLQTVPNSTYQWYKGTPPTAPALPTGAIAGASGTITQTTGAGAPAGSTLNFVLPAIALTDSGVYFVAVTNAGGSTYSNIATLTIVPIAPGQVKISIVIG